MRNGRDVPNRHRLNPSALCFASAPPGGRHAHSPPRQHRDPHAELPRRAGHDRLARPRLRVRKTGRLHGRRCRTARPADLGRRHDHARLRRQGRRLGETDGAAQRDRRSFHARRVRDRHRSGCALRACENRRSRHRHRHRRPALRRSRLCLPRSRRLRVVVRQLRSLESRSRNPLNMELFEEHPRPVDGIRVGIGGWTFAPWRDNFYPKGLVQRRELEYASRKLTAIEVNGTYYGAQKPATYAKWASETPEGFVFSAKAPMRIMQSRTLARTGPQIEDFLGGIASLGDRLGPIVWQFDANQRIARESFTEFLQLLPDTIEG